MAVDSALDPSGAGSGLEDAQDSLYADMTLGVSCLISNQQEGRPCLSRRPVQCVYYWCEPTDLLKAIKSKTYKFSRLFVIFSFDILIQFKQSISFAPCACRLVLLKGILDVESPGAEETSMAAQSPNVSSQALENAHSSGAGALRKLQECAIIAYPRRHIISTP